MAAPNRQTTRVYDRDPLLYAYCGGEVKIIAFITEHATVARILQHIYVWERKHRIPGKLVKILMDPAAGRSGSRTFGSWRSRI